ncbi:sugar porter family MFS transporter [Echinicola jeungdonensis]|uniref:Sugar porter family MFS transporter n=1 Tax=Echinicola jeungdonensis TaxID=709343 RepID=A0ABV5J9U4_9BACT|nr:sugar porter family MFS transporter [Echinicola jeungdonensis]MDN3670452.1 sugar porter family MFS transporter [Echinicola jeungdonensis]
MDQDKFNTSYVIRISMVSALGGLLFGYDWVVIGGAKPFYELFFGIADSAALKGWAMSSALVGCLLGAITSGFLSDRWGRKKLLIMAALLFIVSAVGTGAANSFNGFIFYRILGGISIGLASNLSPMYIAEVTPARFRGGFVSINQLTIVIGILMAQIANYLIANPVGETDTSAQILDSWNGQWGWRWMFWAENVPALIFFILMWTVPRSPRWLVTKGKIEEAKNILKKIGGSGYASGSLSDIQYSIKMDAEHTPAGSKDIFQKKYIKIVVIGIVLAAFQQWSGINIIFNYAEEIFTAAGYGVNDILFNIVITGLINLIFTVIAMFTVDKWGRKPLLTFGALSLAITYIIMGSLYFLEFQGLPLLILVLVGIACYAMSLAPVTWVVLSEIFPTRIRGKAMSFATVSLWSASFLLTYSFPILNDFIGASGTFWLYALICISGWFYIKRNLVETKGKSLEAIELELLGEVVEEDDKNKELIKDKLEV